MPFALASGDTLITSARLRDAVAAGRERGADRDRRAGARDAPRICRGPLPTLTGPAPPPDP
ncbi:hypothetical protein ACE1SV_01740 [Streptomyces sp. E-15]